MFVSALTTVLQFLSGYRFAHVLSCPATEFVLSGHNMLTVFLFCSNKTSFNKELINCPYQVSTSSSVVEERKVVYPSSQPDSNIQWDSLGGEAIETKGEVMDETGEPLKPVMVRFVLEESSGYMEPMLRILAILHTVISFFCIIGYYCLKAGYWLKILVSIFSIDHYKHASFEGQISVPFFFICVL